LISCVVGIGAGYIVGRRFFRALASGILFCGGGENLVGDSHFDVVGFAREDCDGLVLRLPSETSYGAVVAAAIGMAFDAKRSARGSGGVMTGQNLSILNRFDQSKACHLQGNAEGEVARLVLR